MYRISRVFFLAFMLSGCIGTDGGSSNTSEAKPPVMPLQCELGDIEALFEDKDADSGEVSGVLKFALPAKQCNASQVTLSWEGASDGEFDIPAVQPSVEGDILTLILPMDTQIPPSLRSLEIQPVLGSEKGIKKVVVVVVADLVRVTGHGGNELDHWQYGVDRDALLLPVTRRGDVDYCTFDNGNVLVHDSAFEKYTEQGKDVANDTLYPAYEFDCTASKENLHRTIYDVDRSGEEYIFTYSTINDAMYYGNVAFDMFEKYLGTRPLEKLRVRVHHGPEWDFNISSAYWNGAYVTLNDAMGVAYGMASLDIIAHEMGHGVLQEHTALKYGTELSEPYAKDGLTLHEAYSDMAAVAAHFELYNELNWVNGDENYSYRKRYLNQIQTEPGAILSYLDYSAAGSNYYKRMGMMTYPFYLLTNKWGIEKSFQLFTDAARSCWLPHDTLLQSAVCVKETAADNNYDVQDVIDSFRQVKIKLNDKDTFAHYVVDIKKFRSQFDDQSQTDRHIVRYHWDFGDGNTSTEASPYHEYTAAGEYTATLEIEDNLGVIDTLSRTFTVDDQYCRLEDKPSDARRFTSMEIADNNITFSPDVIDHTSNIIDVVAGAAIPIKIAGTVLDDDDRSLWYVWVDLNDDAEFESRDYHSEENNEERLRVEQTDGEFGLDHSFTIPEKYIGQELYMRVSADHFFPCYARPGSTLDVRLKVLAATP